MRVCAWASLLVSATTACALQTQTQFQTPLGANTHPQSQPPLSDGAGRAVRIEVGARMAAQAGAGGMSVKSEIVTANAQTGTHAVLTHSMFPETSVRIKRIHAGRPQKHSGTQGSEKPPHHPDNEAFCDPGVTTWSGYIDTLDGKSLFFYFFESRRDPEHDPVLLWTNGGPGCSSQLGLFMELGPCRVTAESAGRSGPPINATEYNAYSWNAHANTIFIDQPVGVGYSYTRYGVDVGTTEAGAVDLYHFLRIFFAAFPEFHTAATKHGGFHLAGESYAGRYIPIFAAEIVDRNLAYEHDAWRRDMPVDARELVPLKSIVIGNGITDRSVQVPKIYEFACTRHNGLGRPIVGIEQCARMKVYAGSCADSLGTHCRDNFNPDRCTDALSVCASALSGPVYATGVNPYDISDPCRAGLSPNLCYAVTGDIRAFLDRADVRALVGADSSLGPFQACSPHVGGLFAAALDGAYDNKRHVALLLEHGIKALIYNGDLDFQCNGVGHRAAVDSMAWSSADAFTALPLHPWTVDDTPAGETRSFDGLTWATVFQAGHMVPYDKPAQAQAMINRWLADEEL